MLQLPPLTSCLVLSGKHCMRPCALPAAPPLPGPPPSSLPPPALPPQAPTRLAQLPQPYEEPEVPDRPITRAVIEATSIAGTTTVAGVGVAINGALGIASSTAGPAALSQLGFLGRLLNMWGGTSLMAVWTLFEKLQLVGSGVHLAPPQLEQFRQVVQSVAWAGLSSAGEWLAGLAGWLMCLPAALAIAGLPGVCRGRVGACRY
jgi:hypothetical protein